MRDTIAPHHLATALADAPAGIELLSLGCFDTLIWRSAVRDVFADIDAEARRCYAFRPTAELIHDAKCRGLKVAIICDTRFSRAQLAELIRTVAGEDLLARIDHIFCSSEYGVAGLEDLFRHVLRETGVAPGRMLHIGADRSADYVPPVAARINAIHLLQFDETTRQRFRLEAAAGEMVNSATGADAPADHSHQAAIALAVSTLRYPAKVFGYASLGPIFHAFSAWLAEEAAALNQGSGRTHLLFLTGGGHLPRRVFEAMAAAPHLPTQAVEISRFTAAGASFTDEEAVLAYVEREIGKDEPEALARQLLFTRSEVFQLMRKLPTHGQAHAFVIAMRTPSNLRKIIERSRALAKRLAAHVRRQVDPGPGDTLMLVGLGDDGLVQEHIGPLLECELGVRVAGRYLLMRERAGGNDKQGLIDRRHYSPDTLGSFCAHLTLLEQLSTGSQGLAVDYEADGAPIRDGSVEARQSVARERIQQGCIRFAVERDQAFLRPPRSDDAAASRASAAAALARLIFLPLADEIEVLQPFRHQLPPSGDGRISPPIPSSAGRDSGRRGSRSALIYLPTFASRPAAILNAGVSS